MKIDDDLSLSRSISLVESSEYVLPIKRLFTMYSGRSVWNNDNNIHTTKITVGFEI